MPKSINSAVESIELSGIRKFFNLVQDKEDILSLTIGQPDFTTPESVKQAAKEALDANKTTYTQNQGLFELRDKVSQYINDTYNTKWTPHQVLVTVGASQAIDIALRTLLVPGDEVILPSPIYPGYEPLVRLQRASVVEVDTTPTDFKLTAEALEAAITDKTKVVILPYPSNPTGVTLTKEELTQIKDVIIKHDLYLITDEIYSTIAFDTPHVSMAIFEELSEQLIVINGLSKSHAMTGFRIGFLFGPLNLMDQFTKVLQYNVSCATSTSQYAALNAVTEAKDAPLKMREAYLDRRDYVYERLTAMGLEVVKPGGAFYFMFKLNDPRPSFDLALDLVEKARVAFVPGSSFGRYGEGYLRLSYAYSLETLKEGLDRLEQYILQQ
ncbi:MAG: aminotransferase class I/II-fold pyridoxal phosphate-dependent enzyme [Bacillota bacterium]